MNAVNGFVNINIAKMIGLLCQDVKL